MSAARRHTEHALVVAAPQRAVCLHVEAHEVVEPRADLVQNPHLARVRELDALVSGLTDLFGLDSDDYMNGTAESLPPKAPKATGVNGQSSHDARLASTAPVGTV